MAQLVIVTTVLKDDLDGSEATETIAFGLDGKAYEIDLNSEHAEMLRMGLNGFVETGRYLGRYTTPKPKRQPKPHTIAARTMPEVTIEARPPTEEPSVWVRPSTKLFHDLEAEDRQRFRAWWQHPNAKQGRVIPDVFVQEWLDAGRP